jgi:hypothetical protein
MAARNTAPKAGSYRAAAYARLAGKHRYAVRPENRRITQRFESHPGMGWEVQWPKKES